MGRLVRHGEVATFRELCARVLTANTRYLVLDLDRTIHLGRDLGEALGWELCALEGYGREDFERLGSRQQSGKFLLDWDHPKSTARYLARSLKIWAYPGMYYGLWGKAAARLDWLRRRGFQHFVADPIRAAQRVPQMTLLRHLQSSSEDVLRDLARRIWQRHEPDQVIDRDDLAWIRARWPQIQIVLSSASPKPTVEIAGEALGVDHPRSHQQRRGENPTPSRALRLPGRPGRRNRRHQRHEPRRRPLLGSALHPCRRHQQPHALPCHRLD